MRLTEEICENANPKERPYKLFDGGSLYIEVRPTGAKYWRLKYRYGGKEKRIALGVYPDISLAEAREKKDLAKQQLKADIDPSAIRKEEKKNRPKPQSNQNIFNLSLSNEGVLTIETESRIIHLTATQAETLRAFLEAAPFERERKEE